MGQPVGWITAVCNDIAKEGVEDLQTKINATRKKPVKNDTAMRERLKERMQKNAAERSRVEQQRASRQREPEFQTRKVDYTQMKMVKVARGTYLYAKPGEEEKVRHSFIKTHHKYLNP